MSVRIRLLGSPAVERDGEPSPLKGWKAWGLLAYLHFSEVAHGREHLSRLLFSDADDPLRALRWNLTQIRGATDATIAGDPVTLTFPAQTTIDVEVLRRGEWRDAMDLEGLGGDLLEGVHFDDSPVFETWLLVQRRRVAAATEAILREGAMAALASDDHGTAIDLAARLVARDPLREEAQALLVRSYVAGGDRQAAARQLEACTQLLHLELGVDPGPAVASALSVAASSATRPALGGRAAARAQLEAGRAAVRAGVYEAGVECLRRATAEAHACGDLVLKGVTLLELGSALVHGGRNERGEGAAALHEGVRVAELADDRDVLGRACYELAWVDLLDARYDRAALWLDRAEKYAIADDLAATVLWARGKLEMETGRYQRSIELLEQAVSTANRAGDVFRHGFALASLGRSHLLLGSLDEASRSFDRSLEVVREGAPVLVPLAEGFLAEALFHAGDDERALDLAQHAYAYALEVGDVSMIAISARALALIDASNGRSDDAIARLREARRRFKESPDHVWTMLFALDALCEIAVACGNDGARGFVTHMTELSGAGPMPEMTVRALLHRADLGEPGCADAAFALLGEVDNPTLHNRVRERLQLRSVDG